MIWISWTWLTSLSPSHLLKTKQYMTFWCIENNWEEYRNSTFLDKLWVNKFKQIFLLKLKAAFPNLLIVFCLWWHKENVITLDYDSVINYFQLSSGRFFFSCLFIFNYYVFKCQAENKTYTSDSQRQCWKPVYTQIKHFLPDWNVAYTIKILNFQIETDE